MQRLMPERYRAGSRYTSVVDTAVSQFERDGFLRSMIDTAPAELFLWRDRERVVNELRVLLDAQLDLLGDRAWATDYRAMIGLCNPEDYANRIVEAAGSRVLCGIRFYGADATKPFVDVVAWVGGPPIWDAVLREALDAYACFAPRAIRVYSSTAGSVRLFGDRDAVPDQVLSAAPFRVVAEGADEVALRNADATEAHEFLKDAYARLTRRRPDMSERVHASTLDELEQCQREGRLVWWTLDGEIAGLIAAIPADLFGLCGYLMMDEAVARGFSGRGSAAAAQRALARSIQANDQNGVLFGTIDAVNRASRRAAQRAGREEIAGWWFIQPATDTPASDALGLWR
jgi:RimJ/RimL family protein N-acetyltransferase